MVKRLRRRPLTAKTGVRVPVGLPLSDPTFFELGFLQRWRSGRTRTTRNRVYPHKGNKGSNPFLCAKTPQFRGVFLLLRRLYTEFLILRAAEIDDRCDIPEHTRFRNAHLCALFLLRVLDVRAVDFHDLVDYLARVLNAVEQCL